MKVIELSPAQRWAIDQAANSRPPHEREHLLNLVAQRLGPSPSDFAVDEAIRYALSVNQVEHFLAVLRNKETTT